MVCSVVYEMKYLIFSFQLYCLFVGKYCVMDFVGVNGVIF